MTNSSSSIRRYGELQYSTQVDVDEICDRFEAEFKAGRQPDADDFLGRVKPEIREALAGELMALELHYRVDDEQTIRASYAQRFPDGLPSPHRASSRNQELKPGTQLGDFRIERKVGQGGMGIVYAAHDVKLGRKVALKFLPTQFSADQQRLDRFQREAKILASLNHPNIATLHGFAEDGSWQFCVMEYVDGFTLGELLAQRRLPLRECVSIFTQIAEALESAHEAGVVHRDLKPANVKVTPDGHVKVLDFGLAKSLPTVPLDASSVSDYDDPTSTDGIETSRTSVRRTQVTGISGTLPYMSPEQTQGKSVDKRSDIWSYGCCLYETLAGQRAFSGSATHDVLEAINTKSPDWAALPASMPLPLTQLLRRCLQKDPRQRLRDIGEARIELATWSDAEKPEAHVNRPDPRPRSPRVLSAIAVTVLVSVAVTAAIMFAWLPKTPPILESRSTVNLREGLKLTGRVSIAISPDGQKIAFVASGEDDIPHLYVRDADRFEAVKLNGTDYAESPFFSPNGRQIAFFTEDSIKTVSIAGGPATVVCRGEFFNGGCWTAEHGILFCWDWGRELAQVSPDTGTKRRLRRDGQGRMSWPQVLPNGQLMLVSQGKVFLTLSRSWTTNLQSATLDALELGRRVQYARYVPTGHLVYVHNGSLFRIPLKLGPSRTTGAEVLLASDVMTYANGADCAVSNQGDILYVPGEATYIGELAWVSRDGSTEVAWHGKRHYNSFRLSPSGEEVAIGIAEDDATSIWIYNFENESKRLLTSEGISVRPIWSPDGERIVFRWTHNDHTGLYWTTLGSRQRPELLARRHVSQTPVCFNRDGTKLICYSSDIDDDIRSCIYEIDMETGVETPLLSSPDKNEAFGHLSHDDQWLVFLSSKSNRNYEVFVARYPELKKTHWVSGVGLSNRQHLRLDPMWSPNTNDTIFFWDGGIPYGRVMEAKIELDPFKVVSILPAVPATSIDLPGYAYDYDAKTDRFLLVRPAEKVEPATKIRWLRGSLGKQRNRSNGGLAFTD